MHGRGVLGVNKHFFFFGVQTAGNDAEWYRNPAGVFALGANRVSRIRTNRVLGDNAGFTEGRLALPSCLFDGGPGGDSARLPREWLLR